MTQGLCDYILISICISPFTFIITNSYYMNGKFDLAVVALQPTWITQCPLLLLDTRMPYGSLSVGCEEHLDPAGTGSLYNEGEAEIVLQHVFSLIYAGNHI